MKNIDKLKTRIQGLMNQANGTDNEHEAEAFMLKAKALLDKYNIDVADITNSDDETGQQFGATWKAGTEHTPILFFAVCRYFNCKGISVKRYKKDTIGMVIGKESARIVFKYMWPFIQKQVTKQAKLLDVTLAEGRRQISSALALRISGLIAERETTQEAAVAANDLILYNEIDAFISKAYPKLGVARQNFSLTKQALDLADNVSLDLQVAKRSQQLKIGN